MGTSSMDDDESLTSPPEHLLSLLTDVHCHPTDDPRPWGDISVLTEKLRCVKIGRVCAMGTSVRDQRYVAHLARQLPDKIVPAFGYHPWFVHTIATRENISAQEHYRAVFSNKAESPDLQDLLPALPPPVPLNTILHELRSHLESFPNALLGEVGLDRVFRLPRDPKGWSREPDANAEEEGQEGGDYHSLGLRNRPLTNLTPLLDHQLTIVKAQITVAIEMRRSISFHCVRAGGALIALLEDLRTMYPNDDSGLNRRARKQKEKERKYTAQSSDEDMKREPVKPRFSDVNLDLHSCTISPDMIEQVQKKFKNVYVSFSLAINARQKDLPMQLRACDPDRLLIESDWHSAEDLGARCWTMLRMATDTIGAPLAPEELEGEARYEHAARLLHKNWLRFAHRDG